MHCFCLVGVWFIFQGNNSIIHTREAIPRCIAVPYFLCLSLVAVCCHFQTFPPAHAHAQEKRREEDRGDRDCSAQRMKQGVLIRNREQYQRIYTVALFIIERGCTDIGGYINRLKHRGEAI